MRRFGLVMAQAHRRRAVPAERFGRSVCTRRTLRPLIASGRRHHGDHHNQPALDIHRRPCCGLAGGTIVSRAKHRHVFRHCRPVFRACHTGQLALASRVPRQGTWGVDMVHRSIAASSCLTQPTATQRCLLKGCRAGNATLMTSLQSCCSWPGFERICYRAQLVPPGRWTTQLR